jgi:FtsP/CotA-like multicopper oxidase with cupredoxin domain
MILIGCFLAACLDPLADVRGRKAVRIPEVVRLSVVSLLAGGIAMACAQVESRAPTSRVRSYYIAAEEVAWDYAPSGMDQITGAPFSAIASLWTVRGREQLGRVYKKALFREYSDGSFKTLKPRPPEWQYLGLLGPLLRAEVGDTLRVVLKNSTRRPVSLHPHGVFYKKNSEGAPYNDRTNKGDRADDGVPPGREYTYDWPVPDRAGPTAHEGSSAFWMYHSHVSEEADVNAGLIGPMIITGRGKAKPDGTPTDIDREIIIAFAEMDENMSWLFDENIETYASNPANLKKKYGHGPAGHSHIPCNFFEPFCLSNFRESLNGFLFGNMPVVTMRAGERVRWYLMSTTNFEVHAPHWHGNTVVINQMRTDVASLSTMGMVVADMVPDNPGTWLFHCHVLNHLMAGMQARYTVEAAQPRTTSQ